MRALPTLGLVVFTASLGFACRAKTEQPSPVVEPAPTHNTKANDDDKDKSSDEGWEPVPVGGMGGGPSDEATPAPAPKPATKPKTTTPPAAPKPSTSAPPGWSLPTPPSGFTWPSAWPSGWAFPAPSSAPVPSTTPSTNSGGWNVGQ